MGCDRRTLHLGGLRRISEHFTYRLCRFLFSGFSFGEAASAAQTAFSWQTTIVGDPLYRPTARISVAKELIARISITPSQPAPRMSTTSVSVNLQASSRIARSLNSPASSKIWTSPLAVRFSRKSSPIYTPARANPPAPSTPSNKPSNSAPLPSSVSVSCSRAPWTASGRRLTATRRGSSDVYRQFLKDCPAYLKDLGLHPPAALTTSPKKSARTPTLPEAAQTASLSSPPLNNPPPRPRHLTPLFRL